MTTTALSQTTDSDHLILARRLFDWFTAGDMDALSTALDEDVRAHPSIAGGPVLDGREAVLAWCDELSRRRSDVEARPLDFEVHGDCVIVRGYVRHRDGRALLENHAYWLCEIRAGKVTRMESHPSRNAALAACG